MAVIRSTLQFVLKLLNFVLALLGVAMVFYAVVMLNEWSKEAEVPSPPPSLEVAASKLPALPRSLGQLATVDSQLYDVQEHTFRVPILGDTEVKLPAPWFIYAFLFAGIVICVVTFSGAVAAETHNGCCLSCYQFGVALMIIVQILLAAYLWFDKSWDKEIPEDPTGQLQKLKDLIQKNLNILKWFGLAVLIVELLAIGLAMILLALRNHENKKARQEDEEAQRRKPLLLEEESPGQYVPVDRN